MNSRQNLVAILLLTILIGMQTQSEVSAQIQITRRWKTSGTIESLQPGQVSIRDKDGKSLSFKIQDETQDAIVLSGVSSRLKFPATIEVVGIQELEKLTPGQIVRLEAMISRLGRVKTAVDTLTVVDQGGVELGVEPQREFTRENPEVSAVITAEVGQLRRGRLQVNLPRSTVARSGKLTIPVSPETQVCVIGNRMKNIKPGDIVTEMTAVELSTGDLAIEQLKIEIAQRDFAGEDLGLAAKYRRFSDDPSPPRDVRSRNFLLHTDISDRQAQILLDKLELMIDLISKYYQAPPTQIIECYVVRDLSQWPNGSIDAGGAAKIARGEGVTMSRRLGQNTRSLVYSCDKHGVVQHEAVHAYCAQTFGSTGPTWYSEGMAEMGQYWKPDQLEVRIDPFVITYLQEADPKHMLEIVAAGQITGDSWQAYAWRWALCHLLANNPNYTDRFRALGPAMMKGQPASFESVYGAVANEISFEYDRFVEQVGNGYRADLAAWQWGRKFVPLRIERRASCDVAAAGGWQATGFQVEQGWFVEVETEGEWQVAEANDSIDAAGEENGRGRLIGVIFRDFELSEPFELGGQQKVKIPADGDLYVRCQDDWTSLGDNSGSVKLTLKRVTN